MTPKKIALLTDSSADLRWDQARENNIFFVPLRILCEDGEYLDAEGLQTMRTLARNMTFLMKSIALGKAKYGLPEKEERVGTNFIR